MSFALALKILTLAVLFVASGGALFSDWGRRHLVLVGLASIVAILGTFYLIADIYDDLKQGSVDTLREELLAQQPREADAPDTVEVKLASGETKRIVPGSGESFKDCAECPDMVVVPAGSFMMGSAQSEEGREDDEGPQHEVRVQQPFAVGKFEVTWDQWDACVAAGGCDGKSVEEAGGDFGWGKGKRPVINASWNDAQAYVKWLSAKTGKTYRLMSEAEWEYAARAGTRYRYWFGYDPTELGEHAWLGGNSGDRTHPVGQKRPNSWGLHDMHGNVYEWVDDCWNKSYANKPESLKDSGGTWTTGDCNLRVLRGGSFMGGPRLLRSALRSRTLPVGRDPQFGFRFARTLTP